MSSTSSFNELHRRTHCASFDGQQRHINRQLCPWRDLTIAFVSVRKLRRHYKTPLSSHAHPPNSKIEAFQRPAEVWRCTDIKPKRRASRDAHTLTRSHKRDTAPFGIKVHGNATSLHRLRPIADHNVLVQETVRPGRERSTVNRLPELPALRQILFEARKRQSRFAVDRNQRQHERYQAQCLATRAGDVLCLGSGYRDDHTVWSSRRYPRRARCQRGVRPPHAMCDRHLKEYGTARAYGPE